MRAGFGLAVVLAGLVMAGGAFAQLKDASLSARERRAISASGLPRASVVSVKSDLVVAIRDRGVASPGGGVIEGVVLQGEVTSAEAAHSLGYRSMRSTVNVDCVRRRDLVVKMTVFTEPNAKGAAINRHVPGGWVQPSPDAYLAHVLRAVCGPARRVAEAEEPRPVKAAPKPAAAKPDKLKPMAAKVVPAKPETIEVAAAPAGPPVPSEEAPLPTAFEARLTRSSGARPAARVAPPAETAALPEAALRPLTPEPEPSRPAAKPAPPRARAPGKVAVQIAAADSEAQARAALTKIKGKVAPPLTSAVRSVVVDGKTFHRALVMGFQTRNEAQAFCKSLKGDCFVR